MRQIIRKTVFSIGLMAILLLSISGSAFAQAGVTTQAGTLPDGATFLIEVPVNWNGILFLYSHGYVTPGSANPAQDVGDPFTRAFMLGSGFALAGSSYSTTGWAIHEALLDQIAVLDADIDRRAVDTRHFEVEMVGVRIFDDVSRRPSLTPGLELVPQHVPVAQQRVIWSKPIHPHFHLRENLLP